MPYNSVEAMDPEAILAYYNEMGFSDWTQESTGTGMLKAQHPEFETYLGAGSAHVGFGMNCADCHMAVVTEGKTTYTSHKWESPLANQAILDTCAECHGDEDMAAKVKTIQDEITAREAEVGGKLAELKDALAAEETKNLITNAITAIEGGRGITVKTVEVFDGMTEEIEDISDSVKKIADMVDQNVSVVEQALDGLKRISSVAE